MMPKYGSCYKKDVTPESLGVPSFPDKKKFGIFIPVITTLFASFFGLLEGLTVHGGIADGARDANGKSKRFTTSSANVLALGGFQENIVANTYRRSEHCRFKFKMRFEAQTNHRMFVGFKNTIAGIPNTDDPLNLLEGIAFFSINFGTTWRVAHNDGVGATVLIDTGASTVGVFEGEIRAKADDSGFEYSVNGGAFISITANIPALATNMGFDNTMILTATGSTRYFEEFYCFTENDK
jgi:hypothetical protein